jgi:hypothetical protein
VPVHKLILLPKDPHAAIADTQALAASLQAAGFIGKAILHNNNTFYPTGDNFLQLITFLGCSPTIELDTPDDPAALDSARRDGTFCHIELASYETVQFRADPHTRPPRCPHCGQPDTAWEIHFTHQAVNPENTRWSCPGCGHDGKLTDLVFRKTAGFGKVFVEISGIHPAEAVPTERLLNTLQKFSDSPWHYIYMRV